MGSRPPRGARHGSSVCEKSVSEPPGGSIFLFFVVEKIRTKICMECKVVSKRSDKYIVNEYKKKNLVLVIIVI